MKKMKKSNLFVFMVVMMVTALSAVFYSSCVKDKCAGVNCNLGYCSGGGCVCPVGYTGARCENLAMTTVTYNNNTFTTVTLNFNNSTFYSIPAGTSLSLTGYYGDAAVGNASTHGSGGYVISWPTFNDVFPASGAIVENIDVSSNYFFLEVKNVSSYTIGHEQVNYGLTSQLDDYVTVPDDGSIYGIGYYDAFTNSNLYLYAVSGGTPWSSNPLPLPFTQDQYILFTATN